MLAERKLKQYDKILYIRSFKKKKKINNITQIFLISSCNKNISQNALILNIAYIFKYKSTNAMCTGFSTLDSFTDKLKKNTHYY